MKLTQSEIEQFDHDGYLFFPALFKPEEIDVLTREVPQIYAQRRPENIREHSISSHPRKPGSRGKWQSAERVAPGFRLSPE